MAAQKRISDQEKFDHVLARDHPVHSLVPVEHEHSAPRVLDIVLVDLKLRSIDRYPRGIDATNNPTLVHNREQTKNPKNRLATMSAVNEFNPLHASATPSDIDAS